MNSSCMPSTVVCRSGSEGVLSLCRGKCQCNSEGNIEANGLRKFISYLAQQIILAALSPFKRNWLKHATCTILWETIESTSLFFGYHETPSPEVTRKKMYNWSVDVANIYGLSQNWSQKSSTNQSLSSNSEPGGIKEEKSWPVCIVAHLDGQSRIGWKA